MQTTRRPHKTLLLWLVGALVICLDQATKALALKNLADGHTQTVIPRVLEWVFVQNARGAYGLFGDRPWFLIIISLAAFAVIWFSFRERAQRSTLVATALGLVLGGAVGNIIDRVHHSYVVDFIRIIPLPIFEVFNVADAAISIGIALIVIMSLRQEPITNGKDHIHE